MAQINCYLTFSGNCREAMNFYQTCLGGKLNFQTIGESPMAENLPPHMKDCILHATLSSSDFTIMASDIPYNNTNTKGNSIAIMLNCDSAEEVQQYYRELASGGSADHPPDLTYWNGLFGDLTDKFGNHWILNFNE